MEYEQVKRSYSHLIDAELERELRDRSRSRYNMRKVGAADCMIDAYVLRACSEILKERRSQDAEEGANKE